MRQDGLLLITATGLLVVGDAVALLTARHAGSAAACTQTTRVSVVAPVLLSACGFVALMALASRVVATGLASRRGRPRWGGFLVGWVLVLVAFAGSGAAVFLAGSVKFCG